MASTVITPSAASHSLSWHHRAPDPGNRFFPDIESPAPKLLAYRDRIINPWSRYRNRHMGRIGLALSYFLGRQWADLDITAAFDGYRGVFLRELSDDETGHEVRPTTNEIDPAVEAEVISLVKRRWEPRVVPLNNDPRTKAGAQVAHDRVNHNLTRLNWPEKRHQSGLFFATTGTSCIYTGWDRSYFKLKTLGAPSAVSCSNESCSTRLYSADVPTDLIRHGMPQMGGGTRPVQHAAAAKAQPRDFGMEHGISGAPEVATLPYCPTCPSPTPLIPYQVSPEEYDDVDVFGRPMAMEDAAGECTMDVDLPFDFYPENGGARITPDTMRRFGRRKIRGLDWLEERYPHLVHLVRPEPVSQLLYSDPLLNSPNMIAGWSAAYDAGILDNHVNVDELVELPCYRHPRGRYVVCVKDMVLEDSDLLESSTVPDRHGNLVTMDVQRVQESCARFKIRPNEFWGTGMVDHGISPQNRLNGIDADTIETRLRYGPHTIIQDDQWITGGPVQETMRGIGKFVFIKPSPTNPNATPTTIPAVEVPASYFQERQQTQQDIRRLFAPASATIGETGKLRAASALQLMVEQDERQRSLREDAFVGSVEKSWSHLLQLEWVLLDYDDPYRVAGNNKVWREIQYRGMALEGQTEVKIERGSFITKSIMDREGAREALADGVILNNSPMSRRRLAEIYGTDPSINADHNHQMEHADRVWVDFSDEGKVHVQDSIDNPGLHYAVLSDHLRTDDGERLGEEARWEDVSRATAGWEDEFQNLVLAESKAIAFYGGRIYGKEAETRYAEAFTAYKRSLDMYAIQQQVYSQQLQHHQQQPVIPGVEPALTPAPPIPPQPPPPPVFPPVLLQDRIEMVMQSMCDRAGLKIDGDITDKLRANKPSAYFKFRCLLEAYKMSSALGVTGAAAAPSPEVAAATGMGAESGAAPAAGPGTGEVANTPSTAPLPGGGAN